MVKVWPILSAVIGLSILCSAIHAYDLVDCGVFPVKLLPDDDDVNEIEEDGKEKCDGTDTGDINKNEYRYAILEHLNSIRTRISIGCGQQKGPARLPEALNMLRVSYSCEAEKAAAVEVAKCHTINANVTHAAYNVIGFNDIKDDKKRVDNAYYRAIHSIYNYVKRHDDFVYNPNTMLLDKPDYSPPGAKMAAAGLSSSVTKIGCAYKVCPKGDKFDHSVICFSEPKIDMSEKLPPLYEPGASCVYDAECTAEGFDKCDRYLMLCTNEADEDGLGSWSGASSYSTVVAIGAVLVVALLERVF